MAGPLFKIDGRVWANGSADILMRLTARDGTGTAVTGEGNCLKRADISSIIRTVYDLSSTTPSTALSTTTLTIASVVYDAIQTGGVWTVDPTGYNGLDFLPASTFPINGHNYLVQYRIETTGGAVGFGQFVLYAESTFS